MDTIPYDMGYLTDPRIFAVGRMPAVSDHDTFASLAEAEREHSSLSLCLDGRWRFAYADTPQGRPLGFEQPEFDCSTWPLIDVPAHIQLQGYGIPHYVNTQYPWDGRETLRPPEVPKRYNPVGCYVTHFSVPEAWEGHRITLTLHGVESACYVWLNGVLLGYAEDGFTPSRFDLTRAVTAGDNKLAIEVYRFSSASWIEDQDFWRFSGIFRSVELRAEPRAHVEDVFIQAVPDEDMKNAAFTAVLSLRLPMDAIALKTELLDANGAVVDCTETKAVAQMTLQRTIENPMLWSAENPLLYTFRLTLRDEGGRLVEVAQTQVGFRRVEIKAGILLLNGKRLLLHGVNRHEFSDKTGRVLTEAEMRWDIETLKRNNINAVRTCHYPNDSRWYRLCDRYGIYLIDETNLESHGSWMKLGQVQPSWVVPDGHDVWLEACIDRARSMLERDKNHPSVLLWSCGNESYGGSILFQMAEFMRQRDPTRPIHYEGVFHDRRYPATSDVESQMYIAAADVAAWLETHREKPFLLCEYSHAMGNSCGGLCDYVALEDRYPQYQGGFIWDLIDQALRAVLPCDKAGLAYGGDFFDQPTDRNFCGNGLLFADRTASPKLQEVKFLYQNVRITPDARGVMLENRHLFDDLNHYMLTWVLTRDGVQVESGEVRDVRVAPGTRRHIVLPLPAFMEAGEYALLCILCLAQAMPWAEAGYAQMHGQAVLCTIPAVTAYAPRSNLRIEQGDVNIGAYGKQGQALFSYVEGGLVSYRRGNALPVLNHAPRLSLWRAPTDNDAGNGFASETALWFAFSELSQCVCTAVETVANILRVSYRHGLPSLTYATIDTTYEVIAEDRVRVKVAFSGGLDLPDLPSFGLSFRMPKAFSQVRYYGYGPAENSIDRRSGAVLGIHQTTVQDNLTPYLKPQACGNRTGVRWLEVSNGQGLGLRVRSEEQPLEISVLPYSNMELTAARHQQELAAPSYTYLDVAMRRYGVGGDDSWGAPVLEPYRLHGEEPCRFSFVLELL